MALDDLIQGSYGRENNIFAGHSEDRERARQALIQADLENVGYKEFIKKHKEFLRRQGRNKEFITEQIKRVKSLGLYFDGD
jgi:hypothetical protein